MQRHAPAGEPGAAGRRIEPELAAGADRRAARRRSSWSVTVSRVTARRVAQRRPQPVGDVQMRAGHDRARPTAVPRRPVATQRAVGPAEQVAPPLLVERIAGVERPAGHVAARAPSRRCSVVAVSAPSAVRTGRPIAMPAAASASTAASDASSRPARLPGPPRSRAVSSPSIVTDHREPDGSVRRRARHRAARCQTRAQRRAHVFARWPRRRLCRYRPSVQQRYVPGRRRRESTPYRVRNQRGVRRAKPSTGATVPSGTSWACRGTAIGVYKGGQTAMIYG